VPALESYRFYMERCHGFRKSNVLPSRDRKGAGAFIVQPFLWSFLFRSG